VTDAPRVAAVARPVAAQQAPGGARRAATSVPLRHGAAAAPAELGEGPVWDADGEELIWVDIDRGLVHRRSRGRSDRTVNVGQPVGCAVPRAGGGLALALRDGFGLLPPGGGEARLVAPVERERPDTRMNDGACDSRGRFWAGTMSLTGDTRAAALYRLDPDLSVTRVLRGVSVSNGIAWAPDGSVLYHVDSPRRRIDLYDFDVVTGRVGCRRSVIPIAAELGSPDGLAVDAEGGVWVALWGGSAVLRFSPEGTLDERLELPVTNVTSCCFGDRDLGTLYIATAARGAAHEPLAGEVFACRPGVCGLRATPFAG
jgi:sugar lactone lactonase YvrE